MNKSPYKLLVVFALGCVGLAQAQTSDATATNTIQVMGVGQVKMLNTEGSINASVTTLSMDADVALTTNNAAVSNILMELSGVGIDGDDISTSMFNFRPKYRWNDSTYVFEGYEVTNGLQIKVKEVSAIGSVLNLLVDAGATRINSINFGSSVLADVHRVALEKATDDALAKATILANSTGVSLGPVIGIDLLSQTSVLNDETVSGAVSPRPPVPIEAGSNTHTAVVQVTYRINQ
ncbi:SIMPL domain-containing protein [Marinicella meishanensis]|uniref:SIMPL domain-containing protein n=1 Tax=Marinicella meishanensis TaxID=2873263 RepID=UPI001CC14E63|nr:SIMPL domain-containing protein [Marinicella sp. NBU2979]